LGKFINRISKRDHQQDSLTPADIRDQVLAMRREELQAAGKPSLVVEPPSTGTLWNIIRKAAPEKVVNPKVQNQKRLEVMSKTL